MRGAARQALEVRSGPRGPCAAVETRAVSELPVRCTMVAVVALRGTADNARVLLLQRAGPYLAGAWSYVAGHLEPGETGWQGALRELAEETALVPLALYSADRCEQFYDATQDCIQLVPAFVARVADDAAVRLNDEHQQFAWLDFEQAIGRLPFGGQRELFAAVRREFVERAPSPWLRMPLASAPPGQPSLSHPAES